VICTYDRAGVLPGAIRSVLAQDFADFELVIVDDGSTDDTRQVVEGFADPRVRYCYRPNGGLSAARNTGARAARGALLTFLDDDDRFADGALARVAAARTERPNVVTWAARVVDERGDEIEVLRPEALGSAFSDFTGLFQAGTFAVPPELYFEVGGFDEGLRTSHQTEFSLRLLPACRAQGIDVAALDEPLIVIALRDADRRERNDPQRLLDATLRILDRHEQQLGRSPKVLADYLATAGVAAARTGDYGRARSLLARASRAAPAWRQRGRNLARTTVAAVPPLARRVWPPDYRGARG
jgi:glycosyltransferase involved in cell wall biosynthesis